jgi:hypothetical protein
LAEEQAMTQPGDPDSGSDYGYDLAHDVPRGIRSPARPRADADRPRRDVEPSLLTGGDYGYDEAHRLS